LLQAIALKGETIRTPYYSLFLFPFHLRISLWPIVFAQGLFCTIFIYLVVKVCEFRRPLRLLIVLVAALTLFTSLPWFSGQIMPDVFTGLVIVAVFLLAFCWNRLSSAERWFVVIGLTAMLCFHPSFPPLTLLLAAFVLPVVLRRRLPWRQFLRTTAVLLGSVAISIIAMIVYSLMLIHQVTLLPDGPAFPLARVIADGPGAYYLSESCRAGARYALCPYVDELPTGKDASDQFLWPAEGPWQKVRRTVGLEDSRREASDIILHAILRYPWWQFKESMLDFAQQLTMFGGIEPQLCPGIDDVARLKSCLDKWLISKVIIQYFPSEAPQFFNSLQNRNQLPLMLIYRVDVAVVIISLILCAVVAYRWWRPGGRPEPPFSDLLAVIVVGILSNAVLTGILSEPLDRYGARVIWLLPFFVILYFGWRRRPLRPEIIRQDVSGLKAH
jgi:hypothetical protein